MDGMMASVEDWRNGSMDELVGGIDSIAAK